jgi:hypothetical protein
MGLIVTQRYNYHAGEGAFAGLFVGERPRRLSHAHDWLWHWFRGNNCGDDVEPRSDVLQAPDQWPGRPVRTWRDWSDTEVTEAAAQRAADRARDLGIPPLALKGGQVVPFPVKETHNGKEVGAARTDVA